MSFPKYDIELLERQDKLRYRNNFNSLAERETWFRDNITPSENGSRDGSGTRRYYRILVVLTSNMLPDFCGVKLLVFYTDVIINYVRQPLKACTVFLLVK